MGTILEFENRIKRDLAKKAGEVSPSDEVLSNIMTGLENDGEESASMFLRLSQSPGMKRNIAASVCMMVVAVILLFSFSTGARAITAEALRNIK